MAALQGVVSYKTRADVLAHDAAMLHYRQQWPHGAVLSPRHTACAATSCLGADGELWERQRQNTLCLPLSLSISWRRSA